jgi:hypothetical protein
LKSKTVGKFSQYNTNGAKYDKNGEPFVCDKIAHRAKIIQK